MIEIKHLTWESKENFIFKDFNLKVLENEKILLSSQSGKGKTSLLRFIMGFQKYNSGEIYIDNLELNPKNIDSIRKNIAYVSQDVELKKGIVSHIIDEIFSYSNNGNFNRNKFLDLLHYFNLKEDILNKNTITLSGGEKQRVGLIISLLLDRKLYLLDEVSASLDYEMKKKVEEYILEMPKTVILVSHDKHWDTSKFREVKW